MKKLLPIALVAMVSFMFTSCKKDYICNCTYKDAMGIDRTSTGEYHGSKNKARQSCQDNEDYLNKIGSYAYCEL